MFSHWLDAIVLIGLLFQRIYVIKRQVDSAVDSLSSSAVSDIDCEVTVIRESVATRLAARDLVPGDILVIYAVSHPVFCMQRMLIFLQQNLPKAQRSPIPAECRLLIATRDVVVDQSNITSESLCVNKSVGDTLLYASLLVHGDGLAIVLCPAQKSYVS